MSTSDLQKLDEAKTAIARIEAINDYDREFIQDVQRLIAQKTAIARLMKLVLKEGEHYGVVPGTEGKDGEKRKPSLFQAGADTLCLLFRLRPEYEDVAVIERDDFISQKIRCRLFHINTGVLWGEGMGACNSREAKYLNQALAKGCPLCKRTSIIKGREEYGGGWICYAKKGGCGAKFKDDDPTITSQTGQVSIDKVWDLHNTIVKMGNKRAKVAATLTATAASDFFTQDLEDLEGAQTEPDGDEAGGGRKPANGNGNGAVSKQRKATVIQVRDLNMALSELKIAAEQRVDWASAMLARKVANLGEMSPEDADRLIKAARAGEMPQRQPGQEG